MKRLITLLLSVAMLCAMPLSTFADSTSTLDELKTQFETTRQTRVSEIQSQIDTVTSEKAEKEASLSEEQARLEELKAQLQATQTERNQFVEDFNNSEETLALKAELEELQSQKEDQQAIVDNIGAIFIDQLSAEKNSTYTIDSYYEHMTTTASELIDNNMVTDQLKSEYYSSFKYDNLMHAMDIIDHANSVRATDDIAAQHAAEKEIAVPMLTVSVDAMKYASMEAAQYTVRQNFEDKPSAHLLFRKYYNTSVEGTSAFGASENLALGYRDPVSGWYNEEIDAYRRHLAGEEVTEVYGHAENILNVERNTNALVYTDARSSCQVLYNLKDADLSNTLTTDEFRTQLDEFKEGEETELAELESQIAATESQIDPTNQSEYKELTASINEYQSSITECESNISTLNSEIASANASLTTLNSELRSYENATVTSSSLPSDLKEIQTAIQKEEQRIKEEEEKNAISIASAKVTLSATKYTYSGGVKTPSVKVTLNGNQISSDHYTVSYSSGRKNVGIYTVTVTGKNGYTGSAKATYTIVPKGTSISKLSKASKAFTAKWKKQSSQTTGYQVQYSTSKKFSKAKTVTVKGATKTSKKITKLSKKKTYYVRVRTYKTVSGKNYYSAWSSAKSVKTK